MENHSLSLELSSSASDAISCEFKVGELKFTRDCKQLFLFVEQNHFVQCEILFKKEEEVEVAAIIRRN